MKKSIIREIKNTVKDTNSGNREILELDTFTVSWNITLQKCNFMLDIPFLLTEGSNEGKIT